MNIFEKTGNQLLTKSEKSFIIIFTIIVIAELICDNIESLKALHYITKPAIVFSLILFFIKNSKHINKKTKQITLLALVFSVLGDILLMFAEQSPNFFISGLISFLLAHIMYIFVFLKKKNGSINPLFFIVIFLMYASGLFYLLKDGLGDLLIPVIIYMIAILLMVTTAFLRKRNTIKASYILVFSGAIVFVISDSLLALNKFYEPLPLASISIMLTYSIAQLLIIAGIRRQ